jgi:peptidoglycan/xylan/chitin deacetylase (PgdA/CDA1 family)
MTRAPTLVLTYHAIREGPAPLCIPPERLGLQIDLLLESGFEPLPLTSILATDEDGRAGPLGPRFAVTFDDGYIDFLEQALPVLESRRIPATLFAVAGEDRGSPYGGIFAPLLSFDGLAEVARRGVAIGAHGLSHLPLTRLDAGALEHELLGAKDRLEACTGNRPELLAYPFGAFDQGVLEAAARHFRAAFTTQLAPVPPAPDPWAIPRVDACYLDSAVLRYLIGRARPEPYLYVRRWLRRVRGSEPRRPIPTQTGSHLREASVPEVAEGG